jgi:hypothetical protein
MKDQFISMRVTQEMKKAIQEESSRRGITQNELMERAVKMYLWRNQNQETLLQLQEIQSFIEKKIQEYDMVPPPEDTTPDYIEKVYTHQEKRGYVTWGLIKHYAKLSHVTPKELLEKIDGKRITISD